VKVESKRRRLKQWERDLLFVKSSGKCAMCGEKLQKGWHADHVVPFVNTGRTNVFEMQALCPPCNLKKGTKMLDSQDVSNHSKNLLMDLKGFRETQREIFELVCDEITKGKKEIGIHLHIRGGKTMLMRMLSKWAIDNGHAWGALIINNRTELRNQCADVEAFAQDCKRLNVAPGRPYPVRNWAKVEKISSSSAYGDGDFPDDPYANNEYIGSCTIQTLISRFKMLEHALDSWDHKHSQPFLVFVDEAQEFGVDDSEVDGKWEGVINKLQSHNVILVSLSGFPHREDGKCLPGFRRINSATSESERTILGEKIRDIDEKSALYSTEKRKFVTDKFDLQPVGGSAFEFPLSIGFRSSSLCKIQSLHIDRAVTLTVDGEIKVDNEPISRLTEENARQCLRSYLMHPSVVDQACEMTADELANLRNRYDDKTIKGLIFTCSDANGRGGQDEHANMVLRWFEKNRPEIRVKIITQTSCEGTSPANALRDFKKNYDVDIAILKNVGRVGFDCPEAKVLCDISDVRSLAKVTQTWLRISTPYKKVVATVIHPNDPKAAECWESAIGAHMARMKSSESELIDTDQKTVTMKERVMEVGEIADAYVHDNTMMKITLTQRKQVKAYMAKFPLSVDYFKGHTDPSLWVNVVKPYLDEGGDLNGYMEDAGAEIVFDPAEELRKVRDRITNQTYGLRWKYMKKATGRSRPEWERKFGVDSDEVKRWNKLNKQAGIRAMQMAGIEFKKLDDINNVDDMKRYEQAWVDLINGLDG